MSPRRGEPSGAEKTAPTWVKALVGFHVFAICVWALPNPPETIVNGVSKPRASQWLLFWNAQYLKTLTPVRCYLFVTGTWQYWDMFSPDPASTDWYGTVDVEYRDGTKRTVPYPRMNDLPIPMKYVKERYRKFYERAHDDGKPILWPSFAQAMALRAYTDKANPPVVVRLRRHWLFVSPPGKPQPTKYNEYLYYAYAVDQARLRRAAGGG